MSVMALALASLAAVVPAAAFSSSHSVSGVCVSAGTRTTPTTPALYQYAPQAAGLVDVSDIYAPRDVYSMEECAAQYGMQKVSSQFVLLATVRSDRAGTTDNARTGCHLPPAPQSPSGAALFGLLFV